MTYRTNAITVKNILFIGIFFMSFVMAGALLTNWKTLSYGMLISLFNVSLYYGFYIYHKKSVSRYPAQALVVVISSMIIRFLLVGSLLILAFQNDVSTAKPLIVGFILGQVFFLIYHLTVVTNDVK